MDELLVAARSKFSELGNDRRTIEMKRCKKQYQEASSDQNQIK